MKKGIVTFLQKITLSYLRFFAKLQLKKYKDAKIVGITGSSGKSSTREAIAAMLKGFPKLHSKVYSKGNSETGIPLEIMGLFPKKYTKLEWVKLLLLVPLQFLTKWEKYDLLIFEMGIDSPHPPKNMEYLLSIVRPHIGLFLNVSSVHSEPFAKLLDISPESTNYEKGILRKIAEEKGKMIAQIDENGFGIVNRDDEIVWDEKKKFRAKILSVGKDLDSNIRILSSESSLQNGFSANFKIEKEEISVSLTELFLSEEFGYTIGFALAVAQILNLDLFAASKSIEKNFSLPPSRMSLLYGINNSFILDSSYNASKISMKYALETLEKIDAPKKIVFLGDMREIGDHKISEHEEILMQAEKSVDQIILVGEIFGKVTKKDLFRKKKHISHFKTSYDAVPFVKKFLEKDTVILVKGSQNTIFLEYAVEKILRNPEDQRKICRRGEFWDKKRESFFRSK